MNQLEKANFPQLTTFREKSKWNERYKKYEHCPHNDMKFHYFRNQHFGYVVAKSGIVTKVTHNLPVLRGVENGGLQRKNWNQHKIRTSLWSQ